MLSATCKCAEFANYGCSTNGKLSLLRARCRFSFPRRRRLSRRQTFIPKKPNPPELKSMSTNSFRRVRLNLETLEERDVPSTVSLGVASDYAVLGLGNSQVVNWALSSQAMKVCRKAAALGIPCNRLLRATLPIPRRPIFRTRQTHRQPNRRCRYVERGGCRRNECIGASGRVEGDPDIQKYQCCDYRDGQRRPKRHRHQRRHQ